MSRQPGTPGQNDAGAESGNPPYGLVTTRWLNFENVVFPPKAL